MSVKNPISAADMAIAARIVRLRKEWRLSREDLARRSGLSAGLIVRLELGRMPLRYADARFLLPGIVGNPLGEMMPINPLWLAEGMDPIQLQWPLLLPSPDEIGVSYGFAFSTFIQAHRQTLLGLLRGDAATKVPVSWLEPMRKHWSKLLNVSDQLAQGVGRLQGVLTDAALEQAANETAKAVLALVNIELLERSSGAIRTDERTLLTVYSESRNTPLVKSEMQPLLNTVRKLTKAKGMKATLAADLGVPAPRISEWLAGKYEPSGETTLKLLNWVKKQGR